MVCFGKYVQEVTISQNCNQTVKTNLFNNSGTFNVMNENETIQKILGMKLHGKWSDLDVTTEVP